MTGVDEVGKERYRKTLTTERETMSTKILLGLLECSRHHLRERQAMLGLRDGRLASF